MKKHLSKSFIVILLTLGSFGIISFLLFNHPHQKTPTSSPNSASDEKPAPSDSVLPSGPPETPPTSAEQDPIPEPIPTPTATNSESNCTLSWGPLMLINPNYIVSTDWIAARKSELVNIDTLYGIKEGNQWNGTPLLDTEAAKHLNDLNQAYQQAYPGHTIATRSCFRSVGTNCGRLCYATGTSDHHSGYTCDLVDEQYGGELNTDLYPSRPDWQWLHANSYKYGFIDRFVPEWAGGSMAEPVNVDANGTTGLYETWHFRYVGLSAAEEIATGKYNNGRYDSLEHYLKASGRILDLLNPTGCQK